MKIRNSLDKKSDNTVNYLSIPRGPDFMDQRNFVLTFILKIYFSHFLYLCNVSNKQLYLLWNKANEMF